MPTPMHALRAATAHSIHHAAFESFLENTFADSPDSKYARHYTKEVIAAPNKDPKRPADTYDIPLVEELWRVWNASKDYYLNNPIKFGGHNFYIQPADEAAVRYLEKHQEYQDQKELKALHNWANFAQCDEEVA